MPLTIRRAEQRDLAVLGQLGATLIRSHYAFDPHRFIAAGPDAESGYSAFLGSVLDSSDACVFVAEDAGSVVGYIYTQLEPMSWKELRGPAGFIHDIVVAEEARRGGVASALMEVAIGWLREQGAPRVILWTAAPNEAAQKLFRRIGFRETLLEMTMELGV